MKEVTIEKLKKDFLRIVKEYQKNNNKIEKISRDFHRKKSKYKYEWQNFFNTFKEFRDKMLEELKSEINIETEKINRGNINKNLISKQHKKRYVITAAIAGTKVYKNLWQSIQTYCEKNNAELIILPMRGIYKSDDTYDEIILKHQNSIYTYIELNRRLIALDLKINPRQINPLTTLNRYGNKHTSLIIASPKQQMTTTPRIIGEQPRFLYSTGAITLPEYKDTRIDMIAKQDHICGGLIVEIEDEQNFFIRTFQSDNQGGFFDLDKYYKGKTVKQYNISAFVMGDLHCGFEDEKILQIWENCIENLKPCYIVLHDVLDCASINKHEEGNLYYSQTLPPHMKTLQQELDVVGQTLQNLCKKFPKSKIIITKGNHDLWLENYLAYGRYATPDNKENHLFALDLAKIYMLGKDPLKEYLTSKFKLKNVIWLREDSSFKICNTQIGIHGAYGSNGKKASLNSLEITYGPGIYGHTHTPSMLRDVMTVGTTTKLKLFYNTKGGSTWAHASAILYKNGTKSLIIPTNNKWKL